MDELNELAEQAAHYYRALIERQVPIELAVRMAGDWHQAMCQWVVVDTHNQITARQMSRRLVGRMQEAR